MPSVYKLLNFIAIDLQDIQDYASLIVWHIF